jgi:hypothetical protein
VNERRNCLRNPSSIRVEISNPAFGTIIGFARDISDGGASVLVDGDTRPPIGTAVKVRFKKVVGSINSEPTNMKVVHIHRNILGLMFAR